ncbi:IS4 family transposase [Macrococcus brunensis]|uniref:IS4 family transposase n=1 Tax=Macrococcus brunensis TaxID=198483 RepID=UPI001EF10854|nr:IS4 family transposase [Macrococcus brunensis]ULG71483.1 IS4 family transposase [Macrococcus brunensis]ULG71678.1 IS4 family transposase [Macrococcus brunensis]ULG71741.1 IS4 family transposase [Macrococcus brunensis]ULG72069.1 IS4 family transposase [Macrococcus brunensis]ULG72186.1 IS4 family transposase [Macrococcus brunensis]
MDKFTRKSSFEQWISPIDFKKISQQVKILNLDYYTKKLDTCAFIKLLLYSQLFETESLRAVSDSVFSEKLQKTLGFDSISYSQLSRKLSDVPTQIFKDIFSQLLDQIQRETHFNQKRKITTPLKIIDSSTLPLNLHHYRWAKFRKTKSGVKLHLRLVHMEDYDSYPDDFYLTNACENDQNHLELLVDDKECMYVFDRGYVQYSRFDEMTDEGYFFVSRLRSNAVHRVIHDFGAGEQSSVISDEMVVLGTTTNRTEHYFRRVTVQDEKGKNLVLVTNRFDLSPEEISEIYKSRWAIELFFKWIKQHLNVKTFYGCSETAVSNQVYIALIVYCLNMLIKLKNNSRKSILQITRLLKASIWSKGHHLIRRIREPIP